MRRWIAFVMLVGCGPQVATDGGGDDDEEDGDESDDPGDRPGPGSMYAACSAVDECAPLEFCVFPTREGGYCSAACGPGDDTTPCAPSPGAAEVSCLDIGTPDGRTACALDCSDAPCPEGMSCEAIATPDGSRRDVCF